MNKFRLSLIFVSVVLVSLMSCRKDEPTPPTPPSPTEASRTVLVYMAANNNLGSNRFDAMDIAEMQTAAAKGHIGTGRLLVYQAPYNKAPLMLDVRKDAIDTLKVYDRNTMSVEAARMAEVFADVEKLAPAADYGLVLWSHGTGWIHDGIETGFRQKSFGEENGKKMNTSTLAAVITEAPIDFSFLYFDCCYMMSIECLYELRNAVPLIAGSATELPSPGMPYDLNVARFFATPNADIVGAATNTYETYDSYSGIDRTCTMSVVNTDGIASLAEAARAIYEACGGGLPEGYEPQRFSYISVAACKYFDFKDYMHELCARAGRADLAEAFDKAFDDVVLYSAATPRLWNSLDLDRHNGISTYILRDASSISTGNYNQLSWYADVASAIKFE